MLVCPPITCQFVHFTHPIAPRTIHKCIELCLLCSVLVRTIVSSVLLRTSSYEAFRAKLVRPVHNSFDIPDNTVSHPVVFDRVVSSIKIYMRNESLFHQTMSTLHEIVEINISVYFNNFMQGWHWLQVFPFESWSEAYCPWSCLYVSSCNLWLWT